MTRLRLQLARLRPSRGKKYTKWEVTSSRDQKALAIGGRVGQYCPACSMHFMTDEKYKAHYKDEHNEKTKVSKTK